MTFNNAMKELRRISRDDYLLATDEEQFRRDGYIIVGDYDLDRMPKRELNAFLRKVRFDVSDKGIVILF